jgi:hypothetical protein
MSTKVQIRRGSTSSANAFTGAEGELYVDLGEKSLRVHDGVQQGGFLLAKESELTSKVDKINITAGTVGSGSQIPVITYNSQGQITAVSTSTLNIPANIATETYVNNQISSLVNGAPGALDTLKELATALGNDSSFATTITNQLALKANTSSLATVATTGSYNDLTNKPNLLGVNSNIVPFFDFAYNLGSTVNQWGQVYAYNVNARRIVFPSNGSISINGLPGSANEILKRVSSGDGMTWSTLSYDELTNKPFIPNLTSQLMNDAGFLKSSHVKTINGQSIEGTGDIPISQFNFLGEIDTDTTLLEVVSGTAIPSLNNATVNTSFFNFSDEGGSISVVQTARQDFTTSAITLPATYEFWYYPTTSGRDEYILGILGQNGNNISFSRNGSFYAVDTTGISASAGGGGRNLLLTNSWNHIAIYVSSTNYKMWINGTIVLNGTLSIIGSYDYRQINPRLGFVLGGHFISWPKPEGYYGQINITSGDKYNTTGNIVPPTSSFSYESNSVYLLTVTKAIEKLTTSRPLDVEGGINVLGEVIATSFNGDGSQLTNVVSTPKVAEIPPAWQQTVNSTNYTSGFQDSSFSYTFSPSKTGVLRISYYPKDIYVFQSLLNFSLEFCATTNGSTTVIDDMAVSKTISEGSIIHGPYVGTLNVTAGVPVTLFMRWLIQGFVAGTLFNYGGNSSKVRIYLEYVDTVASI